MIISKPHSSFSPRALICDIDGTLTDISRRIDLEAVAAIRTLVDSGIPVVLASGNTVCAMTFLCKMIGTDGTIISENGGVYRVGYLGELQVCGNHEACKAALSRVKDYFEANDIRLNLYSPEYRFADIAFEKTIDASTVRDLVKDLPVHILDSDYALHIQSGDLNKGTAFMEVAREISIPVSEFLAIGDSSNDIEMIKCAGLGVSVGPDNAPLARYAGYVSKEKYGRGFCESVKKFFPTLFE